MGMLLERYGWRYLVILSHNIMLFKVHLRRKLNLGVLR